MKIRILFTLFIVSIGAAYGSQPFETVKLQNEKSDKIVVKMMFTNGSASDPVGKDGLTQLTASLMTEGGTGKYAASDIKSMTYPWASRWYSTVDKEVTVFTFEFHKDHADRMLPLMVGLIVNPSFAEADYKRIKSKFTHKIG